MRLRHAVVTMGMGLLAVAVTGGVRSAQDYTAMMTATPATTPIPSCLPKGTVPDLTDVAALAAGTAHVLALHTDGSIFAWGNDVYGQLGNGEGTDPGTVQNLQGMTDVAAGLAHSLALSPDGTVWSWGQNEFGQLGLSARDGEVHDHPVAVDNIDNATAVAAGAFSSFALRSDGSVLAWGAGSNGTLGNGSSLDSAIPVPVDALTNVTAISAGVHHALALTGDGGVYAWGWNERGQLGLNKIDSDPHSTPTKVSNLPEVAQIAAGGYHTLALGDDGAVWAWGDNSSGQLGDGTLTSRTRPVRVNGLNGVLAVAAGEFHSLALMDDGLIMAWGSHVGGELGIESCAPDYSAEPVQVGVVKDVQVIAAGSHFSLAIDREALAWQWGDDNRSLRADADWYTQPNPVPLQVPGLPPMSAVSAGHHHALVLAADGALWSWGYGPGGELGYAPSYDRSGPRVITGLPQIAAASAGFYHSVAVAQDGSVWAWGGNSCGELGGGSQDLADHPEPQQVPALTNMKAISDGWSHVLAAGFDGSAWVWGAYRWAFESDESYSYQCRTTPTALDITNVVDVAAGKAHGLLLQSDGSVAAYGYNGYGQLGDGTEVDHPQPEAVVGLEEVVAIAAGAYHSLALVSDGTVWAWGDNTAFQLGDGTLEGRSLPAPVPGLQNIVSLSAGERFSLATDADGNTWAWGENLSGQLSNGTLYARSVPTEVALEAPVLLAEGGSNFSLFATNAGAVWAAGADDLNQLGDQTYPEEETITPRTDSDWNDDSAGCACKTVGDAPSHSGLGMFLLLMGYGIVCLRRGMAGQKLE